jgi:Flp pilus assembly protein TadG
MPLGCHPGERGAAAVEMALLLPVLLLLVFGIVDFGRMLDTQIRLSQASREGARAESLGENAGPRVISATTGLSGVTHSAVSCPAVFADDDATVTVKHTFSFITPISGIAGIFGGSFAGTKTLTSTAVMPCRM